MPILTPFLAADLTQRKMKQWKIFWISDFFLKVIRLKSGEELWRVLLFFVFLMNHGEILAGDCFLS